MLARKLVDAYMRQKEIEKHGKNKVFSSLLVQYIEADAVAYLDHVFYELSNGLVDEEILSKKIRLDRNAIGIETLKDSIDFVLQLADGIIERCENDTNTVLN